MPSVPDFPSHRNPPPGGRRIKPKGDFEESFYTFQQGDVLEGVLDNTKPIRGETRYVLQDDHGQRWILPATSN